VAPALEEVWQSPEAYALLEVRSELERSIDQARPRPITPAYQAVSRVIAEHVHLALRGEVAPDTALALADEEIEAALERARTTLEGSPS
jgi:multiple sugar transport system substrate-binding protein